MASIKDVAQLAGVSFSTVSIIINGKATERKISEETQKRVWEAMRKLQYRPNISAKKLKEGETDKLVVALFWSFDFRRAMLIRFLTGLQERLQENQSNIEVVIYPYKNRELCQEASLERSNRFHAAIIANASDEDLAYLDSIQALVPIVLYNRFSDKYSSVNIRDDEVGRIAAKHLYEQGYHRSILLTSEANFSGMIERERSFEEQFTALGGVCVEKRILKENSVESGVTAGKELVRDGMLEKADSLFCASDALAIGVVHSLKEAGCQVPEELAVLAVGNGNPHYSCYSNPPLSVVNIPMEKMARSCYDLLIKEMDAMDDEVERIYFDTELLARRSTERKKL